MAQEKIFKCHTEGCEGGCEEAPGWCDDCIAGTKRKADREFRKILEALRPKPFCPEDALFDQKAKSDGT